MTVLGDVLLDVTDAHRINYSILGNTDKALHAHLFPRYDTEPDGLRPRPPWFYDRDKATPFDAERDGPLMQQIAEGLRVRGVVV